MTDETTQNTENQNDDELLNRHLKNLRELRRQAATYGIGEIPLRLINQIDAEKDEIRKIDPNRRELRDDYGSSLPLRDDDGSLSPVANWMSMQRILLLLCSLLAVLIVLVVLSNLSSIVGPFMPDPTATPTATATPSPMPTATPSPTSLPTTTPIPPCRHAVVVRDSMTGDPIADAEVTLAYKLDTYTRYTDSNGRYQGEFECDDAVPNYKLFIEAANYQRYEATFILMETIEEIRLVSTATRFCRYTISVVDALDKTPVADAKVRVEYRLYYTIGYTDSEGDYPSDLPCDEDWPNVRVQVTADGFALYTFNYTLIDEIKEVRLGSATPMPTETPIPTSTPTRFPPRAENELLVLVVALWVSEEEGDDQKIMLTLSNELKKRLGDHPQIRVEYWQDAISPEAGTQGPAQTVGSDPHIDATFVLWGYRIPKEQPWDTEEVYLYFDVIEHELPIFDRQYHAQYGEDHIQPTMFEFIQNLSHQWVTVVTFAAGLTYHQVEEGEAIDREVDKKVANALFTTAMTLLDQETTLPLDIETVDAMREYQATISTKD